MATQVTAPVGVQAPAWHLSPSVQALPSLQATPSGLAGLLHVPVLVLQTPALWQESSAVHTTGLPPAQVPFWQVSPTVQGLPSLQVEPLALAGLSQAPVCGLQVPALWH